MNNQFLKTTDLGLNPANYLINKKTGLPVNHSDFVSAQNAAHYIVLLSKAIKDKNFTCDKVDNLEEIKASVLASINSKNVKEYVKTPSKPSSKTIDELVKYATDFVDYQDSVEESEKINKIMAQFDSIEAVESVGDYFSEGLVKLNAIYTIKEILAAVKINADKLK